MRRLIERGDNVNEQDEDALFDQLEKSLGTIRQSAALARFVGAEGISGDLARAEAEVRRLATCIEALCQRAEQQHTVTTRLEIAAAKVETDLLGLRQAVEALSFPARGQTQIPARSSARSTAIGIVLALLVLGGSATAWMTAGREPTPGALAHRFVAQLSELRGVIGLVHLAGNLNPVGLASCHEGLPVHRPSERLRHGGVEIGDETLDPLLEVVL
jgi:hypothetical protein